MTDTAQSEAVDSERSTSLSAAVGATLQHSWWLALGLLATVGEQTTQVAETLIQKGRAVEPSVLNPVRRAASAMSEVAEDAGTRLRRVAARLDNVRMSTALRHPAGPTKEEFESLVEEVKDLRAKVADKMAKASEED